jgi:stress response protein SCP2
MTELTPGANASLPTGDMTVLIRHGTIPGAEIDVSAFLVTAAGKVRSDADMCFYGQPSVAGGAVTLEGSGTGETRFSVAPGRIPAGVEKVILTATIHENRSTFGKLPEVSLDVAGVRGRIPCAGMTETALILAELYQRNGAWKLRVVGQGFNGGLSALATHLGVEIDQSPAAPPPAPKIAQAPATRPEPAPAPIATPQSAAKINLEKRMVSLEKKDKELLSLVKKVSVSLEKKRLLTDRAKVALCLDISGSMSSLYKSGKIDTLVRRVMALGYRFDDDGEIDVFLFGERTHEWGPIGVDDYRTFVKDMQRRHPLEGGTKYGAAIERIRKFYAKNNPQGLPVYVMFVTDGGTEDKSKTEKELRAASAEPLFWQFMAIGATGFFSGVRFEFLEKLDELTGRKVDNANFFQVADPAAPSDEEMFELMMGEYPDWLKAAEKARILKV